MIRIPRIAKKHIIASFFLLVVVVLFFVLTFSSFGYRAFEKNYGFDPMNSKLFYSAEDIEVGLSGLPTEAVSNLKLLNGLYAIYITAVMIVVIIVFTILIENLSFKWFLALPIPCVALLLGLTNFFVFVAILNKLPENGGFLYPFASGINTCNLVFWIITIVLFAVMLILGIIKNRRKEKAQLNDDEILDSNIDTIDNDEGSIDNLEETIDTESIEN